MKKTRNRCIYGLRAVVLLSLPVMAWAGDDFRRQVAQLHVDINAVGMEVAALERSATLPASTRTQVFLSLAADVQYTPETVSLLIDGQQQSAHTYGKADIRSLRMGAIHPVWEGNLAAGRHQLQATITGLDRKGNLVQEVLKAEFDKSGQPHVLELAVTGVEENKVAVFAVKDRGSNK